MIRSRDGRVFSPRSAAIHHGAAHGNGSPACILTAALLATALLASPAPALINPDYTVVDLVDDSSVVLILRASAPRDGRMTAEVVEALVGKAPGQKTLTFNFRDAEGSAAVKLRGAFGGANAATAVLCMRQKTEEDTPVGALEIGMTWFGLTKGGEKSAWTLGADPRDLETVWGGSARRLIPAIRYVLSDPAAEFPVASTMAWGKDLPLGKLPGKAHECLVTTDGVVLLCDGGDRVFRPGEKGKPPLDVTDRLALACKSRAMAAGDFNGDGRLDLASWDGARLRLVLRRKDGTFAAPTAGHALPRCRSLTAMGSALVAGADDGVTLLTPNAQGGFTVRRLPGEAGACTVADFNGDGRADLVQASAQGLTFHAGRPEAGAFAPPVRSKVAVMKEPIALVCGDYDTDGQLDVLVAGDGGIVLLSRDDGRWTDMMPQTGELAAAMGAGRGQGRFVAASSSDVNGDGRQAVALFQAGAAPGLFFNRGFACFGIARSLMFSRAKGTAVQALGGGQTTGVLHDLNGDLTPDLLAVDPQQNVWVIYGQPRRTRRFCLTVETGAKGPLTVTASLGKRPLGIRVVRPGRPTTISLPRAGKVTLSWKNADGTAETRDVVVTGPVRASL